jgi:hypothetical protein
MTAFKDSGHFWWQQCATCDMAWFVGDRPADGKEHEADCERCSTPDAELAAARRVVEAARNLRGVNTTEECWEALDDAGRAYDEAYGVQSKERDHG